MDPQLCRQFVDDVPAGAMRQVAFGEDPCPYDDAQVWRRIECDEVGIPDRDRCFVCTGMSPTTDQFTYVQAFNTACDEATITFGVNVPPSAIDDCHRAVHREDCPSEWWYRPSAVR